MLRLVILGPGAAGKSTFAARLSDATGVTCTELDRVFWTSDLEPLPRDEWIAAQLRLTTDDRWILDGDLGPYDAVEARLARANTVVLLDPPTVVCAWRALRRGRERADFWRWLLTWRRRFRPHMMRMIELHAADARLFVISNDEDLRRVSAELAGSSG